MLGLIVLAVFGIYTWLVVLITRVAMRRAAIPWKRTAIKYGLPVALYLAPVADGIYGYLTLQYLCATEAKTEVLRPIRIPAEYFNNDGTPKFASRSGTEVDWRVLTTVIAIRDNSHQNYKAPNLERFVREVTDVRSGEPLVRRTIFYFTGGWLRIAEWRLWSENCIPGGSLDVIVLQSVPGN